MRKLIAGHWQDVVLFATSLVAGVVIGSQLHLSAAFRDWKEGTPTSAFQGSVRLSSEPGWTISKSGDRVLARSSGSGASVDFLPEISLKSPPPHPAVLDSSEPLLVEPLDRKLDLLYRIRPTEDRREFRIVGFFSRGDRAVCFEGRGPNRESVLDDVMALLRGTKRKAILE